MLRVEVCTRALRASQNVKNICVPCVFALPFENAWTPCGDDHAEETEASRSNLELKQEEKDTLNARGEAGLIPEHLPIPHSGSHRRAKCAWVSTRATNFRKKPLPNRPPPPHIRKPRKGAPRERRLTARSRTTHFRKKPPPTRPPPLHIRKPRKGATRE